ncbi:MULTISPECIES: hypothetical protein [unclassified Exiguobacterium]|uniref:hypothetical protein n=1 Tax=unclassified Exiguobacterium TaxID=2644629 RepID=UPI0025C54B63|nr:MULTISPECIES: hypothetical protein [unclassified Exiguobacterium]
MKNHIIFFSGGKSSFSVADWVKTNYPDDNILLYFTDTMWENDDLYRFIYQAADRMQLPMLTHANGLNPIELMFEKKLVYNSRIGDCSKLLKMKVSRDFLKKGIEPPIVKWRNREYLKQEDFVTDATLYFGIGWDEEHRAGPIKKNWQPFEVVFPMIDELIDNAATLKKYDLRQPVLYDLGFTHNNCNGRCVKAGQGHHRNLKEKMPDEFKKLMEQEHHLKVCVDAYRFIKKIPAGEIDEEERQYRYDEIDDAYRDYFYGRADKPKMYIPPAASIDSTMSEHPAFTTYSFMKKTADGDSKPYPLRQLNSDVESEDTQIDLFDIGGCGCSVDFGEWNE